MRARHSIFARGVQMQKQFFFQNKVHDIQRSMKGTGLMNGYGSLERFHRNCKKEDGVHVIKSNPGVV